MCFLRDLLVDVDVDVDDVPGVVGSFGVVEDGFALTRLSGVGRDWGPGCGEDSADDDRGVIFFTFT